MVKYSLIGVMSFLLQPRNMVLTLPLTTVFKRNYGLVKFQIQTSIII